MTIPEPAQQSGALFLERRREPRHSQPATVKVKVSQEGAGVEFDAIMIDSSTNGLAIRHWRKDLRIGQPIRIFLEPGAQPAGQNFLAQVVWNWSVGPVVISGLEKAELPLRGASAGPRLTSGNSHSLMGGNPGSDGHPTAAARTRSWLFAVFGALLVIAGWYFGTRF